MKSCFRFIMLLTTCAAILLAGGCQDPGGGGGAKDQVAKPQLTPAPGVYPDDQHVVISDTTVGAAICYTIDGSEPTDASPVYSAPVSVAGDGTTVTIKAYAWKDGVPGSAVASATYTINYSMVAAPTFSPSGGTYTTDQQVAIDCTTIGADIYYTTDGTTTPSASSTHYTAPVSVTEPCAPAGFSPLQYSLPSRTMGTERRTRAAPR